MTAMGSSSQSCASRAGQAGLEEDSHSERLRLPIDEYVLVMPTLIAGSGLVVGCPSNLGVSSRLPFEILPRRDLFSAHMPCPATAEKLAEMGLQDVFRPDPEKTLQVFSVSGGNGILGALILVASRRETEKMSGICESHESDLRRFLSKARTLVIRYEWEVSRYNNQYRSPCLVTDCSGRILSANSTFCNLAGKDHEELAGESLAAIVHFGKDLTCEAKSYPEFTDFDTPLLIKPQFLFFTSSVRLSHIPTVCGDRLIYVFADLYTDQRTGNSNILLVRKLSSIIKDGDSPQASLQRLINTITATLRCDLLCILRRKKDDELIITPYSNRRPEMLRVNFIEPSSEPILAPFFENGHPVFCNDVETCCLQESFFRQVMPMSRFVFLPLGKGRESQHALLMAWSRPDPGIGPKALPFLRIVANLIGIVMTNGRLIAEIAHEKETLERYARLTAGREIRMGELKKENARLKELLMRLDQQAKESTAECQQ